VVALKQRAVSAALQAWVQQPVGGGDVSDSLPSNDAAVVHECEMARAVSAACQQGQAPAPAAAEPAEVTLEDWDSDAPSTEEELEEECMVLQVCQQDIVVPI
jgi:hypothetical protein